MSIQIGQYTITAKLYESKFTLVYRGYRTQDRLPVILKVLIPETVTQERLTSFKREFEILSKLDLPGVVKVLALESYDNSFMMVLKDIDADSLSHILKQTSLSLTDSIEIMIALVNTVGLIYKEHIIHKDINPSNIIYNTTTKQVNLIDFGIADDTPERSVALQPPLALEGTLEYISPEQTGRMNRPVDYRTDFYSLGVTFYKMLTGKLPFEAEDALGIVYSHIAKTPVQPHEINPDIPEMVSRIVLKMMAKMAEGRYQSAWGLKADLEKCLHGLIDEGYIREFKLGLEDYSEQLCFPEKLYGRQKELNKLLQVFDWVSTGERELFLVAGYAGVGKTRLVREIQKTAIEKQGYFIEGKFEQLQRNVPYFVWIQAFEGLVNYILMGSEVELARWREDIMRAVGNVGRVLTDVIPNLELVIGTQPDVPELGGVEAQNRLNYVFLKFVKSIATKDHPLVIFLDDLQWIEAASLKLLETLITGGDISNFLVIGAYRDNEVDALHPLVKSIETLRKENANIDILTLKELSEETVNELISDTLRRERYETTPLAHLLYSKTGGNSFFLLQTLKTLAEKQALSFDIESKNWKWDILTIERIGITDNVVTLMVQKIRQLPPKTQRLLSLAACVGFKFGLSNLNIIARQPEDVTLEELQPTLREGLITAGADQYQFVHDRVQQAAYSLIPEKERSVQHLKIGRLLLVNTPEEKLTENIFKIVDHLNRGMDLITEPAEHKRVAELNLIAGRRARASTAYALALNYFTAGITALNTDAWETRYDLIFSLYTELSESEYLIGNFARSEELLSEALKNAQNILDRAWVYRLCQRLYQHAARWPEAVNAALKGLELLGLSFPESKEDIRIAIEAENKLIQINLRGRRIADLADEPFTDDAEAQLTIGLLAEAMPQFYITSPPLWPLIVAKCVNLCLVRGNVEESPYVYSTYCMMLVGLYNDIPSAFQFSEMSLKLNDRIPKGSAMRGRPLFFHASVVNIWWRHFETSPPLMDQAFQAFLDSGDLVWASYLTYHDIWLHLEIGDSLAQVTELAQRYATFNLQNHNDIVYFVNRIEQQFTLSLQGKTKSLIDFNSDNFDEVVCVAAIQQAGFELGIGYFRIMKLIATFIAGHYDEALQWANHTESVLPSVSSMAIWSTYYFYYALTMATIYDQVSADQQEELEEKLTEVLEKLKSWAANCPENFANRAALVKAEIARIEHRDQDAMRLYEEAIASAHENRFIQYEAVAYEIAAGFYRQRGFDKIARSYMSDAVSSYSSWGATGKVRQLELRHPWLIPSLPLEVTTLTERLDMESFAKAQQAISSEIEMDKLLDEVMRIVVENAGAQIGFLLLEQDGAWQIAAKGGIGVAQLKITLPVGIDESELVAQSVVRFVARTKESVVLDDAAIKGDFVNDPHIVHERTKSLLCAPLLSRGRLIGVLYLENNLTTQAFSPERIQLLEILVSQASISLENARVYEALRESEELNRLTLGNLIDAVFVTDDAGSFIYICPNVDVIFGYSLQEVQSIGNIDYLLGEELFSPAELETSQRLTNIEHEIGDKFGKTHALIVNVVSVDIKGGTRLYTCRDITERKQAEDALKKREEEYRRIVDTSNEGIWILGRDTITTFANTRMAEMLGYRPEEMLGYPPTDFMFEEDVPDHLQKMENRRKGISEHYERRFCRKDGQAIWTLAAATPIFDNEQRHQGSFAMFTDITEHKQFEERQRDFYRRTILAATEGKLQLTEREEIEKIAGSAKAVYQVASPEDFRDVRNAIIEFAFSLGMDEIRAGDYRAAVGEAVTNATKHANGGTVSIHDLPDAILTVISDNGPGIEAMSIPEVALKKGYSTVGTLGMGYKVMISIADKVYMATGSWGTVVGIEMNVQPPEVIPDISAIYHAL